MSKINFWGKFLDADGNFVTGDNQGRGHAVGRIGTGPSSVEILGNQADASGIVRLVAATPTSSAGATPASTAVPALHLRPHERPA